MIKIATWNVNSIRSRITHLLDWLKDDKPDVVLLQELKCTDVVFPSIEIEELGYNIALYGEKSYNGVAILSKYPLDDISKGLTGDAADTQSRYIEAVVNHPQLVLRVASVYVPNGSEITSDKFEYKLRFLDRLHAHIKTLLNYEEALIIGGDYNIAPTDADVHKPKVWANSVLTHDEVRLRFRKIINLGFYDAATIAGNSQADYTWWDYRGNAFSADDGLRIDHLLLSPQAADKLTNYYIKKDLRGLEKPSDHAPVVIAIKG